MKAFDTGNAQADAVNSEFSHNIGMIFQGAWDIVAPFVGAALVLGIILLVATAIVKKVVGGRSR